MKFLTILDFLKYALEYIDPSSHFVFYEVLCSSFFVEFPLDDAVEVLLGVRLNL